MTAQHQKKFHHFIDENKHKDYQELSTALPLNKSMWNWKKNVLEFDILRTNILANFEKKYLKYFKSSDFQRKICKILSI